MAEARRLSGAWTRVVALLAAIGASACSTVAAHAQTQLPGITVTTPSPVTPSPAAGPGARDRTPADGAGPRSCRHRPADLARPGLRGGHGDDARANCSASPRRRSAMRSRTQPGIAATTFAPGASRPVIRGLSGFRVRIQENGLATGDVSALSDDHAVPIDPLAAGQVEVVRGPATLRYGSQAIGGVVNAVNNRIPTAIPTNGILVETRGGFSTVDDGRNGAAIVEAGAGNFVDPRRYLRALRRRLPHTRRDAGQHQPRQRGLLARRLLRVQGRLRRRRLFIVRQHLFHSRHRGRRAARTTSCSTRRN